MTDLKVYWQPGCSSCVRVKEFLTGLGVDYEAINVAADPAAMEELRELGARSVPVVVRGRDFVFGQELADVSRFIGRQVEFQRLPAQTLIDKWLNVLAAAQRYVVQIPAERLAERATPGRDRSVRSLAYHIHQIPDAFLKAVENGVQNLSDTYGAPLPSGIEAHEIRAYGAEVAGHLQNWWVALPDKSCVEVVDTYYGAQPLHHLLERCTWHSAQHVRQMIAVLERLRIQPDRPLTAQDYAGLPMPIGLWE